MAKGSTNSMGRKAVGRGDKDRVINSGQRPTVGNSVFQQPVDAPSSTEFRAGMLSHKEGFSKSDAPDSRGGKRKGVMAQSALGARYHITPNVNAVVQPEPDTLRNTRVVPSAMGTGRNFWNQSRSYGAY